MYSAVTERCFMMEASGVHRQEALIRQAVNHVSPLACTVGLHGFLKEASTCRIEAPAHVGVKHPLDLALLDSHRYCLKCMMRGAARSESVGESPKVPLVDGLEHRHRRPLDDFIFPCRFPDGPLATIRFWDGDPLSQWRVIRPPFEPVGQVPPVRLQVLSIGGPRLPVNSRGCIPVEPSLRLPESLDIVDMVPQRRQWPRTSPRCRTYAVKRLLQGTPALRPDPGLLNRLPLGQLPSLHGLRRGRRCSTTHVVRSFRWYYGAVRLPAPVHHGRAPVWIPRADLAAMGQVRCRASRVPHTMFPCMPGVFDPARSAHPSPYRGGPCCLPRVRSASAPEKSADFGAPYPACTFPCQRFTGTVTGASA